MFEDLDYSVTGPKPARTNRFVRCLVVRNVSGIALLPKRLVTFQQTAGFSTGRVDGYATATAVNAFPVDEFLPTAGVPNGDLFYIVTEGPASCITDLAGGANNLLPLGTLVVALTAVTSQATTAGRIAPQDLTGATALLGNQIQNRLGYALTAKTTTNTNAGILIDIRKW